MGGAAEADYAAVPCVPSCPMGWYAVEKDGSTHRMRSRLLSYAEIEDGQRPFSMQLGRLGALADVYRCQWEARLSQALEVWQKQETFCLVVLLLE